MARKQRRRRVAASGGRGSTTLPEKKKAEARARLEALDTIDTLVRAGVQTVVATVQVGQRTRVSASTIYRWRDAVAGLERADWLPALAPRHAGRVAEVECPAEAWEVLKADYLRPGKAQFQRLFPAAREHGRRPRLGVAIG